MDIVSIFVCIQCISIAAIFRSYSFSQMILTCHASHQTSEEKKNILRVLCLFIKRQVSHLNPKEQMLISALVLSGWNTRTKWNWLSRHNIQCCIITHFILRSKCLIFPSLYKIIPIPFCKSSEKLTYFSLIAYVFENFIWTMKKNKNKSVCINDFYPIIYIFLYYSLNDLRFILNVLS